MGEFAVSFELSRQFVDDTGKPTPFIHIAQTLETAFNFSFGDAYKSKARVFKRKPYNLTRALDYLKNLIIRADRKQDSVEMLNLNDYDIKFFAKKNMRVDDIQEQLHFRKKY